MSSLVLQSPAKLNLYLKVNQKRPDGYHDITTLFERIDLTDELTFSEASDNKIRITCDHPHVPVGPKNLVYQAAVLLQQACGIERGVRIAIRKRIPVAAGLAGGSSNAATALLGLNKIWKLGLTRPKLVALAKKIGSDVPFFLYDARWALGYGRGDLIKPVEMDAKLWHILVVPKVKMYSWKVYGGLKLQLTKKDDNVNILIRNLKRGNVLDVSRLIKNDLESVVLRHCPTLRKLQERLKFLQAKGVMISGSGPSVYGLTTGREEAEEIKRVLSRRFSQVFVVRTA